MIDSAAEAKEIASRVAVQLHEREKLHDERHAALQESVQELKSMVTWIGSTMITLILGVLAWSLAQQYSANEAQKKALEEQVNALRTERLGGTDVPVGGTKDRF